MKWIAALIANATLLVSIAHAQLLVEITQGRDNPTTIAVVPFADPESAAGAEDIARIIQDDLQRSGQFDPVQRSDMLGLPTREDQVFYRDWRALNTEYLVIGRVVSSNPLRVEFELYDVLKQTRLMRERHEGPLAEVRMLAHRIADRVYEQLTGIPGAFATQLLYVASQRVRGIDQYQLMLADSDGARPRVVLESSQPIMSPAWAPDGENIAYVSFETSRPAIFRHHLPTGRRQQLTNFTGLNGSPAWSPDGRRLAMVLSKDGNPDIYVMDLASGELNRLTRHYAIDTEPAWMPDGKSLLFTSDRGGKPQIYRVDIDSGLTSRMTYEGDWNARARIAQDGRNMVVVTRINGQFHVALVDLVRNTQRILTSTELDESPSIAPNGSMLLYATKAGDRGILAAVSVDGGVRFRLPAREGDVREPAWSPYLYR
jgi:TolB protein